MRSELPDPAPSSHSLGKPCGQKSGQACSPWWPGQRGGPGTALFPLRSHPHHRYLPATKGYAPKKNHWPTKLHNSQEKGLGARQGLGAGCWLLKGPSRKEPCGTKTRPSPDPLSQNLSLLLVSGPAPSLGAHWTEGPGYGTTNQSPVTPSPSRWNSSRQACWDVMGPAGGSRVPH